MSKLLILIVVLVFIMRLTLNIDSLDKALSVQNDREQKLEQKIKDSQQRVKILDGQLRDATKSGYLARPKRLAGIQEEAQYRWSNQTLSVSANIPQLRNYIKELFGSHSEEAERVVNCESGFNPNAYNSYGHAYGLFQITDIHTSRFGSDFTSNPFINIRVAHQIWQEQGWTPWISSRNCWG